MIWDVFRVEIGSCPFLLCELDATACSKLYAEYWKVQLALDRTDLNTRRLSQAYSVRLFGTNIGYILFNGR